MKAKTEMMRILGLRPILSESGFASRDLTTAPHCMTLTRLADRFDAAILLFPARPYSLQVTSATGLFYIPEWAETGRTF